MSEQSENETQQRFEYSTQSVNAAVSMNSLIDNMAADGWRLVETIENASSTSHLVFERPVGGSDE